MASNICCSAFDNFSQNQPVFPLSLVRVLNIILSDTESKLSKKSKGFS